MTPVIRVSSEPIGVDDLAGFLGTSRSPFVVSSMEHVGVGEAAGTIVSFSAFRTLAEAAALEICNELLCDAPDDLEVYVRYRVGALTPGEAVLLVSVRNGRFEEAYGACGRLTAALRSRRLVWREPLP